MSKKPIPLLQVHMPDTATAALHDVLRSGFVATGQKTAAFEKKIGNLIGNPNVVATNSGSSAIALALYLAGIRPGDEVISTPLTCLAVNEQILHTGAKIIWADIDVQTGNLSPASLTHRISGKTKAVVFSHWVGRLADIERLNQIAVDHDIVTIEDAASALGGEFSGKPVGTHSDYVAFSFQAVKHITTGDGGLLAVQNQNDKNRALLLRNHGNDSQAQRTPISFGFDIQEAGWKCPMNDIAATLGLCQLDSFSAIRVAHQRNLALYESHLHSMPGLTILTDYSKAKSNPWLFTVLVEDRPGFIKKLQANQIGCSVVHMRNDQFSIFRPFQSDELPSLDYFFEHMINLPIGWWVNEEDVDRVCEVIAGGW